MSVARTPAALALSAHRGCGRAGALALVLGGCTWVSPADLQAKLGQVDDDADGYAATEDCDDADSTINPDAVEAWYDGIDADCKQDDDFDADGDGFVADADVGAKTEGLSSSGNLPGGDCDDATPETRPGAADDWYDGVDTDCDGRDDFDVDGDGYVRPEDEGAATANLAGSGGLPGGDCDDDDSRINPDAVDTWYSGIDEDCAGNDDYDQDGDGQVAPERAGRATIYVDGSGALPDGDCDDSDPTVYTGAAEDYYTDVDEDCDPDTVNFDQDGDGVLADMAVGGSADCDDTDPDVYPGASEVFADGVDADCDGSDSTFVMGGLEDWSPVVQGLSLSGVGRVRVAASASTVWFTVAADQMVLTQARSEVVHHDAVVAFGVPLTAPEVGVTQVLPLLTHPTAVVDRALAPNHDLLVSGDRVLVAYGRQTGVRALPGLAGYEVDRRALLTLSDAGGVNLNAVSGVGVAAASDGSIGLVACDDGGGATLSILTSWELLRASTLSSGSANHGDPIDSAFCLLDSYDVGQFSLHHDDAGGLRRSSFATTVALSAVITEGPLFSMSATDISVPRGLAGRWVVAASDTVNAVQILGPGDAAPSTEVELADPVTVQAVAVPSTASSANPELVIGYVDAAGDAYVAWGDRTVGWEVFPLSVDFAAKDVAVFVDDNDNVYVAVAGEDDLAFGVARR